MPKQAERERTAKHRPGAHRHDPAEKVQDTSVASGRDPCGCARGRAVLDCLGHARAQRPT
jgi:hypothetical protein